MPDLEPITRDEMLWSGEDVEPITRREMYIRHLYDETQVIPDKPITREEMFILKAGQELHDVTIEQLTATENRTYSEEGVAYSPVIVNVPQPTLTTLNATENRTYTAPSGTAYNEVEVNVPLPENAYLLKNIENTPTAIATFSDGANLPMPSLKVGIEPIQSGSGDPSPSNVRPIIGWDECNVSVSGVNVWDEEWEVGGINDTTGNNTIATTVIRSKNYIPLLPNHSYYYHNGSNKYIALYFYDKDKNYIRKYDIEDNRTFNTYSDFYYLRFVVSADYGTTYNNDISINYPSTDTSYHAYNGQTYTIDLNGTRYGGKVDLVSGVMTVDRVSVDLGSKTWESGGSSNQLFATDLTGASKAYMCEAFKCVEKAPNHLASGEVSIYSNRIYVYNGGQWASPSDFKTAMNGIKLIYELATPSTFTSQPTAIKSNDGVNNVWADCGQILEGEYFSKEA